MLKKTITYTDYLGNTRTEDFFFNLSRAEVITMSLSTNGGLDNALKLISESHDNKQIVDTFTDIIAKSYGVVSFEDNGKRFRKSPELSKAFMETEAYSELIIELMSDPAKMADFINSIIPKVDKADNKKTVIEVTATTL